MNNRGVKRSNDGRIVNDITGLDPTRRARFTKDIAPLISSSMVDTAKRIFAVTSPSRPRYKGIGMWHNTAISNIPSKARPTAEGLTIIRSILPAMSKSSISAYKPVMDNRPNTRMYSRFMDIYKKTLNDSARRYATASNDPSFDADLYVRTCMFEVNCRVQYQIDVGHIKAIFGKNSIKLGGTAPVMLVELEEIREEVGTFLATYLTSFAVGAYDITYILNDDRVAHRQGVGRIMSDGQVSNEIDQTKVLAQGCNNRDYTIPSPRFPIVLGKMIQVSVAGTEKFDGQFIEDGLINTRKAADWARLHVPGQDINICTRLVHTWPNCKQRYDNSAFYAKLWVLLYQITINNQKPAAERDVVQPFEANVPELTLVRMDVAQPPDIAPHIFRGQYVVFENSINLAGDLQVLCWLCNAGWRLRGANEADRHMSSQVILPGINIIYFHTGPLVKPQCEMLDVFRIKEFMIRFATERNEMADCAKGWYLAAITGLVLPRRIVNRIPDPDDPEAEPRIETAVYFYNGMLEVYRTVWPQPATLHPFCYVNANHGWDNVGLIYDYELLMQMHPLNLYYASLCLRELTQGTLSTILWSIGASCEILSNIANKHRGPTTGNHEANIRNNFLRCPMNEDMPLMVGVRNAFAHLSAFTIPDGVFVDFDWNGHMRLPTPEEPVNIYATIFYADPFVVVEKPFWYSVFFSRLPCEWALSVGPGTCDFTSAAWGRRSQRRPNGFYSWLGCERYPEAGQGKNPRYQVLYGNMMLNVIGSLLGSRLAPASTMTVVEINPGMPMSIAYNQPLCDFGRWDEDLLCYIPLSTSSFIVEDEDLNYISIIAPEITTEAGGVMNQSQYSWLRMADGSAGSKFGYMPRAIFEAPVVKQPVEDIIVEAALKWRIQSGRNKAIDPDRVIDTDIRDISAVTNAPGLIRNVPLAGQPNLLEVHNVIVGDVHFDQPAGEGQAALPAPAEHNQPGGNQPRAHLNRDEQDLVDIQVGAPLPLNENVLVERNLADIRNHPIEQVPDVDALMQLRDYNISPPRRAPPKTFGKENVVTQEQAVARLNKIWSEGAKAQSSFGTPVEPQPGPSGTQKPKSKIPSRGGSNFGTRGRH